MFDEDMWKKVTAATHDLGRNLFQIIHVHPATANFRLSKNEHHCQIVTAKASCAGSLYNLQKQHFFYLALRGQAVKYSQSFDVSIQAVGVRIKVDMM